VEDSDLIERLVARIADGACLEKLEHLASRVTARELPVMQWSQEDGEPGAVVSGFIDLVYRDPGDDRLVVADYKTDSVEGNDQVAERSHAYEPQLRAYAQALRTALDLDYDPPCELWFLAADEIVRL
jgi:ATP-dependent exoDNAse (exonuclease V) beta subunit